MTSRFTYYLHDESMHCEVMENICEKLPEGTDVELVANKVKDFCYEVGIQFEWDSETNKLTVVGVE